MGFDQQFMSELLTLAQEGGAGQPSLIDAFGVPVMMMIALYVVLVLLPQNRDRKMREDFLKQLKKNDQVVTAGGIFGTVTGFSADGTQVTIRVDDNARIRVRRSSIESVVKTEEEKSA